MSEITTYKGFNRDWTCRGFQYEVGKTYEHEGDVVACMSGFHGCENPIDVLSYYAPASSKFAVCKQSGDIQRHDGDSKVASAKITIEAELSVPEFVRAVAAYFERNTEKSKQASNTGNRSMASNTGDWSMASNTGNRSMASNTGDWSMASNTGDGSMASNTGDQSMASNTGDWSMASNTGHWSMASNTGHWSMASNTGDGSMASNTGDGSMASNSGHWSMASNTGDQSMASNTGNRSMASNTGKNGVAVNGGYEGRVSGAEGCALFLVERDRDGKIISVWAGIAGQDGIKADTAYLLENGQPKEADNA